MGCCPNITRLSRKLMNDRPNRPQLQQDGSLIYPDNVKVNPTEGYHIDPENPQRLVPNIIAPCKFRITGVLKKKEGGYETMHVCNCSACPLKSQQITLEQCSQCDFAEVDS